MEEECPESTGSKHPTDINATAVPLGRFRVSMVNVVPIAGLLPGAAARIGPQLFPKEWRWGIRSNVNVPSDPGANELGRSQP